MKAILKILKTTKHLWPLYVVVGASSVSIAILNLILPLITGRAIDEIRLGESADTQFALMLAFGVFAIDIATTFINNLGGYFGDQIAVRMNKSLSQNYYTHLTTLPQRFFDTELSGKIIARLNRSITEISSFMQMMSNNFLQFIFSTIFSLIVIAILSWPIALMLATLYPIYVFMTVRTSNTWLKYQAEKNENIDIASGRFSEAITQMKVVKSFNQENRELNFFERHFGKMVEINKPQSRYWHAQDVKRRVVLNVIFLGVYAYIFVQGANGSFTPGQAVTLILYAMQIRIPIFTISFLVERTQKAVADSKDYFEILEEKPHHIENTKNPKLSITHGTVEFDKVSFGYDNEETVLRDVSVTFEPNQTVALVGESGGGKTTITNLLMRLYEVDSGEIRIDGKNINSVTLRSLRENIGVVFQEPALFSGTIAENIAYADEKASKKKIIAAAKAANAHDFITRFDKGYESQIGERGLKLSGGQKQRIAIARALLKDAPILILDEATSSLDNKSERLVQQALDRLMKGRTTIMIAHRLSTIAKVDKIVTLKNGAIDEVGTPSELAGTRGVYASLLALQDTEQDVLQLKQYDIDA